MRYLILSLLSFTLFAGDEKTPPQPVEVVQATEVYEKALAALRKTYEAGEAKIREDACKKLEKVKSDYAKKGDLDGGVMVNESLKKFRNGEVMEVVEGKMKEMKSLFKPQSKEDFVVGNWLLTNNGVRFSIGSDNTCLYDNVIKGKWEIKGDKLLLNWSNGTHDSYDIPKNTKEESMVGVNSPSNGGLRSTKMK